MSESIGFIGLGQMGLPMAKNLLKKGYNVFGFDTNPTAMSELQSFGGNVGKIEDWVYNVQFILLMLPSSTIVNKVLHEILDAHTFDKHIQQDSLMIIDMSSSYPSDTKKNNRILENHHISFIDAPVSGGVKKAIDGSLTVMAGGTAEQFERSKRLLGALGRNLFHVGPIGSGHLMKAINNFLSATHLLASCEAIQLLAAYEVHPEQAIHVINQSTGRSGSTEYKFPNFILNEEYNSGFSLDLLRKDVEMAKQLFAERNAATHLPELVFEKFNEASQVLAKGADHTEINRFVSTYLLKKGEFQ
ncbi:NAD(P)-dependent oxidoreductase [Cytobacillus depressus]|uniref:NAD(P)-dependent oxidoreductase n=1 Tax=Cytobacillus depressus TaxID=1602942 RepID=A0A6L3V0C8_9BACI|nr:NAD(P)-dependent oxidoreductase [Cytobacillus depressus]KAB2330426.1 NAD(P)-dependent oxidoreductase [Cytobacillus depressus]